MAAAFENVCVVGDDAQSIYAFRGANIQNILNFKNDYPDVQTYKLEQNYRSTKNIVNAANSIIENNKEQIKKEVWTDNSEGKKIKVHRAATDNEEGKLVANLIFETQHQHQAHNKDFAILYRTNAQSRAMEEALRRKNIPYKIYGGLSFYQRKEIKDLLSYFRLIINPNDEEALKRVINYPARGIGKTSLDKITIAANNHQKSLWEIITNLHQINIGINNGAISKIQEFISMIQSFAAQLNSKNAFDLGNEVATTSGILKELYSDRTPEGISRYENIQELLNGLKEFTETDNELEEDVTPRGLSEFLQDVALLTNADNEKDEDRNKVTLMTIHSAKGLEFPYVHIVGLEENLFPSQMALASRTELEEERRLFYVAITRAEKELHLSFANSRYKWGSLIFCESSRFIDEIDEKFLEHTFSKNSPVRRTEQKSFEEEFGAYNKPKSFSKTPVKKKPIQQPVQHTPKNLKRVSSATATVDSSAQNLDLQKGTMVNHQKFGNGIVEHLENGKATINFQNVGNKQLLLKFAKLTIIN